VAWRVTAAFVAVVLGFGVAGAWAVAALRAAASDAVAMRTGYLPLALALRDAVGGQDVWNTQLNHVTAAANPADQRAWFDLALRGGRPNAFGALRDALVTGLGATDTASAATRDELLRDLGETESLLQQDREQVARLFDAIDQRDVARAESMRDQLVTRGYQAKRRLAQLEQRVDRLVDSLMAQARAREQRAMIVLLALGLGAGAIGIGLALHARAILRPLAEVTARARAVARGDLSPRAVGPASDEIGVLAATFERMVGAIARANQELVAAERLATIGKMAAKVTHEIRNPLSSMALNAELLEDEVTQHPEASGLVRAMKSEIERLTALSERYLSVARRATPLREPEDIGALCRDTVAALTAEMGRHGVRVEVHADEALPAVPVDEAQLRQVLLNLLRNAREAMPDGGTVRVGVRPGSGAGVEITIDDEGPGLPPSARERLFEPFYTTKPHGTGLGLVISREIVEAHGGALRAEAAVPRGTRFSVYLPG
ncbi:MAG: HAMP domain-containing protein, partial [Deltaproteobacteria bacterium]|nr:HAMP domain-containing protein [Deltaproteobacteria bacterium]